MFNAFTLSPLIAFRWAVATARRANRSIARLKASAEDKPVTEEIWCIQVVRGWAIGWTSPCEVRWIRTPAHDTDKTIEAGREQKAHDVTEWTKAPFSQSL